MNLPHEYVRSGLALVPVPPRQKGPTSKGWNLPENAVRDESQLSRISGNIGLAHAFCSPRATCAIDIDNFDKAIIWFAARGIDLQALLDQPEAVQIFSGRMGSAKLLYRIPQGQECPAYCKITDPVDSSVIVELRCRSLNGLTLQDLLPPSVHPDTGTIYAWGGKGHFSAIPDLPEQLWHLWQALLNAKARTPDHASVASCDAPVVLTLAQVQQLRNALLFLRADDRDLWVRMGMALKETGDVGRGVWLEWSATSAKFDPADAARTWDSFAPTKTGYRAVFNEARRQGWVNPKKQSTLQGQPSCEIEFAWPVPLKLPAALNAIKPLDPVAIPDALRAWALDGAHRLQCPIEYLVMPALASAGSVIGNRVGILPKQYDDSWIVFPVMWGAVVGPPGSMKTPTLNAAIEPLRQMEKQATARFNAAYEAYHQKQQEYLKQLAAFKKADTSSGLPDAPKEPVRTRYTVNDVTYQKLGEILAQNPRGVLALADELTGLLQSLDAPGQEAARSFFLAGWGGNGSYSFDRIQRGTLVLDRYSLSVYGGFQPDRLKTYVRQASAGSSSNDGLLQRFQLLVWPDINPEWQHVDAPPDKQAQNTMHTAILRLDKVTDTQISGAFSNADGVQLLRFSDEAQALFDDWFQKNETKLRNGTFDPSLQSHLAKYRSLVPGLALLYHLLDGHEGAVCGMCLARAMRLTQILRSHANRIYASVRGTDNARMRTLAQHLLNSDLGSEFTARAVHQKGWAGMGSIEQIREAADSLVELGWLQAYRVMTGGRPSDRFRINPGISDDLL